MKIQEFKNAAGALATRNEGEARLAWPERSGGNQDSREDEERRCGGFIGFSELGAGCSKDGLGQGVPATVKMRARCPRSLFESGFISDLGLSTFGPSTLHFQNFRISAFQRFSFPLLPPGVGQMLVQAENFRKKFRSLPIPHLRVPLKHAAPLPSSHFGFSAQAHKHLFRTAFPLLGDFQKLLRPDYSAA